MSHIYFYRDLMEQMIQGNSLFVMFFVKLHNPTDTRRALVLTMLINL